MLTYICVCATEKFSTHLHVNNDLSVVPSAILRGWAEKHNHPTCTWMRRAELQPEKSP